MKMMLTMMFLSKDRILLGTEQLLRAATISEWIDQIARSP